MIGKKDLIIAVLATFCLTATLFMVLPTRSQYDPWTDLDESGGIDSTDLGMLGSAWGEFGDPTKNVNIGNHSAYEWTEVVIVAPSTSWVWTNYTKGYRRVAVAVICPFNRNLNGEIYFDISGSGGTIPATVATFSLLNVYTYYGSFDVGGSSIRIIIRNNDVLTAGVGIGLYMTM